MSLPGGLCRHGVTGPAGCQGGLWGSSGEGLGRSVWTVWTVLQDLRARVAEEVLPECLLACVLVTARCDILSVDSVHVPALGHKTK